tara:strand:+ start:3418 stop:3915 length:498 start_codon:yes stop_codon:yes gene_type:complete
MITKIDRLDRLRSKTGLKSDAELAQLFRVSHGAFRRWKDLIRSGRSVEEVLPGPAIVIVEAIEEGQLEISIERVRFLSRAKHDPHDLMLQEREHEWDVRPCTRTGQWRILVPETGYFDVPRSWFRRRIVRLHEICDYLEPDRRAHCDTVLARYKEVLDERVSETI